MLLNAETIKNTVEFIKARELNVFIASIYKKEVELLLNIKYEDIDDYQELLTEEYLENYGIVGEARDGHFLITINKVIEYLGLKIEDFKDHIDENDWELYEKWLQRNNAKSA